MTLILPGYLAGAQKHGSAYVPGAVHFDGNTFLSTTSLVTVSSPLWSVSFWFNGTDVGNFPYLFIGDPTGPENVPALAFSDSSRFDFNIGPLPQDDSNFWEGTTSSSWNDGAWHNVIFSIDATMPPRKYSLYVDDLKMSSWFSVSDPGSDLFNIGANGLPFQIGYDNFNFFTGDVSDFRIFYGVSLLDGSGDIPILTRRLFIDGSGKPVNPSVATASLGTGTILFSGNASSFGTNQGTGGTFTATGALTNASTHP